MRNEKLSTRQLSLRVDVDQYYRAERLAGTLTMSKWVAELIRKELGDDPLAPTIEQRVESWVIDRLGAEHMSRKERALRLLEEAIELAQAEGVEESQAFIQVGHVFRRPAGNPEQEAGGVATCLAGWAAAAKTTVDAVAGRELRRIEAKSMDEIRASLDRKMEDDLVTVCSPDAKLNAGKALEQLREAVVAEAAAQVATAATGGWAKEWQRLSSLDLSTSAAEFHKLRAGRELPDKFRTMSKDQKIAWLDSNWPLEAK